MDTSIRLCTMDGLPELCNLSINTFYETFAPMNTAEDMENYLATSFDEAKFRRELSDSNTDFFFVYSGEELAGYIKLNEAPSQSDVNDKTSLEIERIYISCRNIRVRGLALCLWTRRFPQPENVAKSTSGSASGRRTRKRLRSIKSTDSIKLVSIRSLSGAIFKPTTSCGLI